MKFRRLPAVLPLVFTLQFTQNSFAADGRASVSERLRGCLHKILGRSPRAPTPAPPADFVKDPSLDLVLLRIAGPEWPELWALEINRLREEERDQTLLPLGSRLKQISESNPKLFADLRAFAQRWKTFDSEDQLETEAVIESGAPTNDEWNYNLGIMRMLMATSRGHGGKAEILFLTLLREDPFHVEPVREPELRRFLIALVGGNWPDLWAEEINRLMVDGNRSPPGVEHRLMQIGRSDPDLLMEMIAIAERYAKFQVDDQIDFKHAIEVSSGMDIGYEEGLIRMVLKTSNIPSGKAKAVLDALLAFDLGTINVLP